MSPEEKFLLFQVPVERGHHRGRRVCRNDATQKELPLTPSPRQFDVGCMAI